LVCESIEGRFVVEVLLPYSWALDGPYGELDMRATFTRSDAREGKEQHLTRWQELNSSIIIESNVVSFLAQIAFRDRCKVRIEKKSPHERFWLLSHRE